MKRKRFPVFYGIAMPSAKTLSKEKNNKKESFLSRRARVKSKAVERFTVRWP